MLWPSVNNRYPSFSHFKSSLTSSAYNKTRSIIREPRQPQWRKGTVANMLRQRVYTGCLVQGTKENVQVLMPSLPVPLLTYLPVAG